ncbi:acetolactate decarboxylase [Corynebacterium heidelbergense]|uniref:Alpha-acetolactate decarboxylase n=1 Tax=Corynebacterium heidelbergense TaxID=2055947 RepID=A0A364V993_9CORY|nr:acetolactate decarboxylase [Corynebacterium heidelbergense]RAV33199.1 acetolactate decarboxylase [Corynebacterium heidelbergense]
MTKQPVTRHTIFQYSLMSALLDGIYDGELSVNELLGKGNFGIGTFDALDGEMVILDGECFRLDHTGRASRPDLDKCTPFAVATNFVPRLHRNAPVNTTREALSEVIDEMLPSSNYMYALKITGRFSSVRTRTVVKQERPYRPMAEVTEDDTEHTFENIEGVVMGFRTPIYEKGIGVPGCHAHFLDKKRELGGHVLDFTIAEGTIELCVGTDLELRLPLTGEFAGADLDPDDLDEQIQKTEVKE